MAFITGRREISKDIDKEYWQSVKKIVGDYTGLPEEHKSTIIFARHLYQMLLLGSIKQKGEKVVIDGMIPVLKRLKNRFKLALITTAPEDIVLPTLRMARMLKLFDHILTQPLQTKPSKAKLIEKFQRKYGRLLFYIGNTREDMLACRRNRINGILAKWDEYDEVDSDYHVKRPQELLRIITSF